MTETPCFSLDEIRSAQSVAALASAFQERLEAPRTTPESAIQRTIASRLVQLPPVLRECVANGGASVGLDPIPDLTWTAVLASAGGRPRRIKLADGSVVAIDYDYILKAFLFCYFAMCPKPQSPIVAAAILGLASSIYHAPLPFAEQLWAYAWQANEKLARGVLADVVDFVTLHEAGHIYTEDKGCDFLQITVVDPSRVPEGPEAIYGRGAVIEAYTVGRNSRSKWQTFRLPGSGRRLILPSTDVHELDEYAPDVFAFLARIVLDSSGTPDPDRIADVTPARFLIWNLLFVFETVIEESAVGSLVDHFSVHLVERAKGRRRSHPLTHSRTTVLTFHLLRVSETLGAPDPSAIVKTPSRVYERLWSSDELWMGVYLLAAACRPQKDDGAFAESAAIFDARDAQNGAIHTELPPHLKALALKAFGELKSIMPAPADRRARERQDDAAAERVIAGLRGDRHFGTALEMVEAELSALPKVEG